MITLLVPYIHVASQERQSEIDSLIVLYRSAGRNWNLIAERFIEIGEPAVPALVGLLQDSSQSQWTRRIAAMTLNDIHSPLFVQPALELLLDRKEDPVLRNHVTAGLKGFDLSHVSEELWNLYKEQTNEFYRLNIAALLASSDTSMAYRAYRELYLDSDGYCRQQALKNLAQLRPHESTHWFMEGIQADDWMTGNLAMDSLVSTIHFDPDALLRCYHRSGTPEEVRWRIIYILGHRAEQAYLDLLVEALSDPGWLVHNEAAVALSRMPPGQVLPAMKRMGEGSGWEIECRAAWVIGQMEDF